MHRHLSQHELAIGLLVGLFVVTGAGTLFWAGLTGRLTSYGSDQVTTQEIKTQVASQADWAQGQFAGTQFDGTVLKLNAITPTTTAPTPTATTQTAAIPPAKTVSENGFKVVNRTNDSCTFVAPTDWTQTYRNQPIGFELYLADPTAKMYAILGHLAVSNALTANAVYQGVDPNLYSLDINTSIKAYAGMLLKQLHDTTPLDYTSEYNQAVGDYTLRSMQSAKYKVIVFYTKLPGFTTGGPAPYLPVQTYEYQEVVRMAMVPLDQWTARGNEVARIAASTVCLKKFIPSDPYFVKASSTPTKTGSAATDDSNGSDPGYNAQLGTEYVRDSSGNNYLVDPSTQWSSTGPAGAGYYKQNGNDYELLQPGRWD